MKPAGRPGPFWQRITAGWARERDLLLAAAQFLTRLPLPSPRNWTPQTPVDCLRYLPLAGAGVGLVAGVVLMAAQQFWSPEIAALLALWASVALTGALHEDGWADTCDGLWGQASRERALQIMKDSRLGTYGVCGLVLMLGLRWALLAEVARQGHLLAGLVALVWSHAGSRALAVALMAQLPYAGDLDQAKWRDAVSRPARHSAGLALIGLAGLGLVLLAAGARWELLAGVGLLWAGLWAGLSRWLRRRLGGYTGDTLGAAQQLGEAVALLGAVALH